MLTTARRTAHLLMTLAPSVSTKPYHREADLLFKDYYSRRLSLTPKDHLSFLKRLTPKSFNEQDHRWLSLTQNVQKNLHHYSQMDEVYMLKGLVDRESQVDLV
jgi:hypothetical protein